MAHLTTARHTRFLARPGDLSVVDRRKVRLSVPEDAQGRVVQAWVYSFADQTWTPQRVVTGDRVTVTFGAAEQPFGNFRLTFMALADPPLTTPQKTLPRGEAISSVHVIRNGV